MTFSKHEDDATNLEDQISQLPDEILIHILSLLKIKEAGRSSVLSSRWKDLWKFSTRLNLYDLEVVDKWKLSPWEEEKTPIDEMFKYVTRVNEILRLHEGNNLDQITIEFILDASCSKHIDEWIKFILSKRVKRLAIHLGFHGNENYSLSDQCFRNPSSMEYLTSFSLCQVNITDEHLEYISKLPQLERLYVAYSKHPLNLRVAGNAVQLKYLYVHQCNLTSIELCAPKLATFHYHGEEVNKIHIGNNPLLAELILRGSLMDYPVVYALVPFLALLSQLETLTLRVSLIANENIPRVPVLGKLKHMIMEISGKLDESLIGITTSLITSAPCLQKITVKLFWGRPAMHRLPYEPLIQPHQCLKEVEIFGFVGCRSDFELVAYLWKNALNLQKMVIKPYYSSTENGIPTQETRERVEELQKSAPLGLELIIS